jgi:hypothetical protein
LLRWVFSITKMVSAQRSTSSSSGVSASWLVPADRGFDAGMVGENLLGGGAAQLVLAADEEIMAVSRPHLP